MVSKKLTLFEMRKAEKKKIRETAKILDGKVVKLTSLNSSLGDKLIHIGIINNKLEILENAVAYFPPDLFCPSVMEYYPSKKFIIEHKSASKKLKEHESGGYLGGLTCYYPTDDLGEVLFISQIRISPKSWKESLMRVGLDLEKGYCETSDKPMSKKLYELFTSRNSSMRS